LNAEKLKNAIRRYSDLIERNKDRQAYSDFKEGINEGLEIAKDTFEENADDFDLSSSHEDRDVKMQKLQERFNLLIDTTEIAKKPNYSEEQLEGIHKGFERSKSLFGDFIKEFI
jgi:hypothetical protein